jgi:hypothetical protein
LHFDSAQHRKKRASYSFSNGNFLTIFASVLHSLASINEVSIDQRSLDIVDDIVDDLDDGEGVPDKKLKDESRSNSEVKTYQC